MKVLVILSFWWVALTPAHPTMSPPVEAIQADCAAQGGELTRWHAVVRRYRFEWRGQQVTSVYSGYDLVCARMIYVAPTGEGRNA